MTLYDSNINYTEWYQAFVEHCELNEIDHTQYNEESQYFFNWIYGQLTMDWDDLITEIENGEHNSPCMVVGTVGTWRGNFTIEPKRFETLVGAIQSTTNGCDYITIEFEKGAINVVAIHHDGRHYFTIHKLNEQGAEIDFDYDDEEFDIEKHTESIDYLF